MKQLFCCTGVQFYPQSKNSCFISTNMHLEIPAFGQQKTPIKSGFSRNISFLCSFYGGPGGIRTLDLSDANRTLSQLSYGPLCYCGTLRLPQNADLLRRCRTIYGKSAYRFHYITPCGKNQDFLRIFVPDFGECSAWRESAAGDGSRSNANSPFRGIALTYR